MNKELMDLYDKGYERGYAHAVQDLLEVKRKIDGMMDLINRTKEESQWSPVQDVPAV